MRYNSSLGELPGVVTRAFFHTSSTLRRQSHLGFWWVTSKTHGDKCGKCSNGADPHVNIYQCASQKNHCNSGNSIYLLWIPSIWCLDFNETAMYTSIAGGKSETTLEISLPVIPVTSTCLLVRDLLYDIHTITKFPPFFRWYSHLVGGFTVTHPKICSHLDESFQVWFTKTVYKYFEPPNQPLINYQFPTPFISSALVPWSLGPCRCL